MPIDRIVFPSVREPILGSTAPWKRRFLLPRIAAKVASGAPDRVLIGSNKSGKFELYSYDLALGTLQQLTNRPFGTPNGYLSDDGQHVYYLDDEMGNETGHFVRIPFGHPEAHPQDLTPAMPKYSTSECFVDGHSSRFGFTLPGPEGFDSYLLSISSDGPVGSPRRLNRSPKLAGGPILSADGTRAIVASCEAQGGLDFGLFSFDSTSGERIAELSLDSSSVEPVAFSPLEGDPRILATSTESGPRRPGIWDATSGKLVALEVGSLEGDIEPLAWSPDAGRVVLSQLLRASQRLYLYDLGRSAVTRLDHPSGAFDSACFRGREILLRWQNSTHPPQLIALDPDRGSSRVLLPSEESPPNRAWTSVTFPSSDGQEIQGWVAVPPGDGPFPTILETHGGPTYVEREGFSPSSQMWLDHGFAYASINYRGSTTFGKEFEKKIYGDLGHWEVEDMVAARDWLVNDGVARADTIFLTGWSYGGYLTLQAMGLRPDLWAGGIGGVVVADWVTQFEDESENLRGYDLALFGGPPSEKRESYERASPIRYLENVSGPILIIQGRNDSRDPPRQVELYEAKARALGKEVRVLWFDSGHIGAFVDIGLSISHHEAMLRFVYDVLNRQPKASPQS
jgi:dipeptidyl aminopeptidase/acylaminoacyl peptidase